MPEFLAHINHHFVYEKLRFLHFHERDLARSLLLFSPNNIPIDRRSTPLELNDDTCRILACSTYGHYQTPVSLTSSYQWVIQYCCLRDDQSPVSHKEILNLSSKAKNPFLFIANALRFQRLQNSGKLQSHRASSWKARSLFCS